MKVRDGLDSFEVVFDIVFFVGAVQVVAVQSKSHKDDLDAQFFF
jgi:hypothetical protein